jgi:hypothetical protein
MGPRQQQVMGLQAASDGTEVGMAGVDAGGGNGDSALGAAGLDCI